MKCDKHDRSIYILEDYLQNHSYGIDLSIVDTLAANLMEGNDYVKALQHIKHALASCVRKESPLFLKLKEGICHIHLGHLDEAEVIFLHNSNDVTYAMILGVSLVSKHDVFFLGLYVSAEIF